MDGADLRGRCRRFAAGDRFGLRYRRDEQGTGADLGSYLRHMLYLFVAFNIGFAGVYLIGLSIG